MKGGQGDGMDEIPDEDTGTPEVADVRGPVSVEKAAASVTSIADQTLLAVQQLGVGSNTKIHFSYDRVDLFLKLTICKYLISYLHLYSLH